MAELLRGWVATLVVEGEVSALSSVYLGEIKVHLASEKVQGFFDTLGNDSVPAKVAAEGWNGGLLTITKDRHNGLYVLSASFSPEDKTLVQVG
jgi:hypothetical protein